MLLTVAASSNTGDLEGVARKQRVHASLIHWDGEVGTRAEHAISAAPHLRFPIRHQ